MIVSKEKFLSRNRGGCCGGDPSCVLNQVVERTNSILALYDKDRKKAVELLDNIFCDMGEEIDMLKMTVRNLREELHQSKHFQQP